MRWVLRSGALGRPRGMGWGGRWEWGSGWGRHVNPQLIHVNVWQNPLQYCKVISFQLIKINGKKKCSESHFVLVTRTFKQSLLFLAIDKDQPTDQKWQKFLEWGLFIGKQCKCTLSQLCCVYARNVDTVGFPYTNNYSRIDHKENYLRQSFPRILPQSWFVLIQGDTNLWYIS